MCSNFGNVVSKPKQRDAGTAMSTKVEPIKLETGKSYAAQLLIGIITPVPPKMLNFYSGGSLISFLPPSIFLIRKFCLVLLHELTFL
jgi:hypothetical protein